jgi:predicted permease
MELASDLLLRIAGIIFPVLAIVLIGWFVARRSGPSYRSGWAAINAMNVQLLCPFLVFGALTGERFDLKDNLPLIAAATAIVLGSGLLAWPIARLAKLEAPTFVPPMMVNNSGNMGLPLAVLAFGPAGLGPAVAMFAVANFLHFSVGMKLLDPASSLRGALTHPMILATLAGLTLAAFDASLPPVLALPIELIGDAAIPLMLLALGVRLVDVDFRDWRIGLLGAVVCPLTGIALALPCVWLLPLDPTQRGLVFLFASLPPAVLNFIFAERFGQQPEKVASIVLIGNLASLLFVPIGLLIGMAA